ncbi:hypothetical protein VTK73DRAFT_690 [Phialemonium thermophilum]|uniref:Uncharacterized protein n=1 Tax=Phialemonium thermophilum TaxID=223376 RepID=A0ABR3VUM6_9PEZI
MARRSSSKPISIMRSPSSRTSQRTAETSRTRVWSRWSARRPGVAMRRLTPLRRRAFSAFLLSPPVTVVLTSQGAQRRRRSSTAAICLQSSRVGARTMAKRPESRWMRGRGALLVLPVVVVLLLVLPVLVVVAVWPSPSGLVRAVMRCTMGSRYAKVLPEPVSACRKASLSSRTSWGMVFFWMAVGAFMPSLAARCWAMRLDRPRARKLAASSDRGALDGFAGSAFSSPAAGLSSKTVRGVGLEVNSLEVTWPPPPDLVGPCEGWPAGAASSVLCRFAGLPSSRRLGGGGLDDLAAASTGRGAPAFLTLFWARTRSRQRPPLNLTLVLSGASPSSKLSSMPSSAMAARGGGRYGRIER